MSLYCPGVSEEPVGVLSPQDVVTPAPSISGMGAGVFPTFWTAVRKLFSDGVQAAGGTQYLKFFPDGTSSGAAIRLVSSEDAYDIVVHPHSGRVVYEDAEHSPVTGWKPVPQGADAASSARFAIDRYDLGD